MKQEKIVEGELYNISLYTAKVHETEVNHQTLTIQDDQLQVFELFQNISTTVGEEYSFDKLKPTTNVKEFIIELMEEFPNEDIKTVKHLLNDFKDNLKTQQRMSNRYVLLAIFKDNISLIHSRKEPGIGRIDENEKSPLYVIKRYFDTGNVDRWVRVFKEKNVNLRVRLYERFKSPVLHDFLGLPKSESFYEFGDIRLIIRFMGNDMSVDFSIEEAIKKIIDTEYITFNGNSIIIDGTSFQLIKILSGKNIIDNPTKLKKLLQSEKYSLSKIIKEYHELPNSINYYGFFLSENHNSVFSTEVSGKPIETLLLEKPDNDIEVICTDSNVWPTEEYLHELSQKVYQGNGLAVFHPAHKFRNLILDYGNIKILNECNIPQDVDRIIKQLFEQANQYDTGNILKHIYLSHATTILSDSVDEPLKTFFSALAKSMCGHCYTDRKEMITKNENNFIEYKSGKKITGNIDDDIDIIINDVIKKTANSPSRLILYGIDEKSMKIDELHPEILKSDNIGKIEESLREKTGMIIKASSLIMSEDQKVLAISSLNSDYKNTIEMGLFN